MLMDKELLNGCGCGDEACGCGEHEHEHHHDDCGCGCGCGEEHEHGPIVVDLEDEEGNVVHCEVVDGFEYKDNEYVLVQNPDDGSIYLFKVVGEGEEGELVVPDDEEFDEVTAYYEETLSKED
ncbi:hypothetical protein CLORY_25640 [Clostridium oryzae]|uniref:DUF1292 domain-containing protein n=2 Tax=Clostridium oryzae TaxID=1450648 RepID=A0A1V4IMY7_9CLOT|nr:hypothetical protein CLORY_25640 [Clostridium oryzae]